MSFDLLGWLGAVDGAVSDPEFRVLFRLCWHANQTTGEIYPSIKTLGEATGQHPRTVMRHIKSLEEKRYIEVARERWPNGTQMVNRYKVLADISYVMPDDRKVKIKPDPIGEKPGDKSVTWTEEPGDNSDIDRVTVLSPIEEGRDNKEVNTPLTSLEAPFSAENLFGEKVEAPVIELHDRVVQAWNEMVTRFPGISKINVLNESRKKKIYGRAADMKKLAPTAWAAWERVLKNIQLNTYLCGEDPPGRGYTDPFALGLDFVLRPSEFTRIFEGGYRANRTHETHDPISGRRYGPGEQAGRAAIAGLRAASSQSAERRESGSGQVLAHTDDGRPGRLRSAFDGLGIDITR